MMDTLKSYPVKTMLVDTGVTDLGFINTKFIEEHGLNTLPMKQLHLVLNADGSVNASGTVDKYVRFQFILDGHIEILELPVVTLNNRDIYLGHEWLARHNPHVNW